MTTKSKPFLLFVLLSLFGFSTVIAQEESSSENESDQKEFQKINFYDFRGTNSLDIGLGGSTLIGDYDSTSFGFYYRAGYKRSLTPHLFAGITANGYNLSYEDMDLGEDIDLSFLSFDFNLEYMFLPTEMFSPFLYGGLGLNTSSDVDANAMKVQVGFGFEFIVAEKLGFKVFYEYNYAFEDDTEFLIADDSNDKFMRLGIGLNYYFGGAKQREKLKDNVKTIINSNPIIPDY